MESFAIRMDNLFKDRMDEWANVTKAVKLWNPGESTAELRTLGLLLERQHFRARRRAHPDEIKEVKKQHSRNQKRMKQLLDGVEEFQATDFYLQFLQTLIVEKYDEMERVERRLVAEHF